jgi:hypothetical protein
MHESGLQFHKLSLGNHLLSVHKTYLKPFHNHCQHQFDWLIFSPFKFMKCLPPKQFPDVAKWFLNQRTFESLKA